MRARDFFDSVRNAAIDAERCKRQLLELESRLTSIGGGSMEPMSRGSMDPDRLGRRVAMFVDRERELEARMDEDFRMIDRGCVVLYGDDQVGGGGLCKASPEMSSVWADVLWWRYCAASSWDEVAKGVSYSVRPCQLFRDRAFEWMDRYRFMSRVMDL